MSSEAITQNDLREILSRIVYTPPSWTTLTPTLTNVSCSGAIGNSLTFQYEIVGNVALMNIVGRMRIASMTRTSSNPGVKFTLPFTPASTKSYNTGGMVVSGGVIRPESSYVNVNANGTCEIRTTETNVNAANGNFIMDLSFFVVVNIVTN